jgi:erythromycin esterase-like protein
MEVLPRRALPGAAGSLSLLRRRRRSRRRSPATRRQRAVGVVFDPALESQANYIAARITGQFDAVVHVDQTRAVPR